MAFARPGLTSTLVGACAFAVLTAFTTIAADANTAPVDLPVTTIVSRLYTDRDRAEFALALRKKIGEKTHREEASGEDLVPEAEIDKLVLELRAANPEFDALVAAAAGIVTERFKNRLIDPKKINVLVGLLVFFAFFGYFTREASLGRSLFVRKIAGLQAIDDAIGRCTEMGKPVLFVPGIYDMDDIQTIAAVSILGNVAHKTAQYDTPLLVPCTRSLVMSTSQEVVREAYLKAGRPDAYQRDNIRYLTDDQFGYVAGVDGIMMRDRPAANFYLGVFFAESLILAETGHAIGSIQIAGTAMVHQIPFFVAACDFTLIGEELLAASAYLSGDVKQLGSLKAQDAGKVLILTLIALAVILELAGFHDWVRLLDTQ